MNKVEHSLVSHYRIKPSYVPSIIGHVRWQLHNDEAVHLYDDDDRGREVYAVNVDAQVGCVCWDPSTKNIVAFLSPAILATDPRVEFDGELKQELQELLALPCPKRAGALERLAFEYAGRIAAGSTNGPMQPGAVKALLFEFDRDLTLARATEDAEANQ